MPKSNSYSPYLLKNKKMSKAAYSMKILGMWTLTLRSLLFNLLVFFFGVSIGMGFSIVNILRTMKEKYANDTIAKLERALVKSGTRSQEIDLLLCELRDKLIDSIDLPRQHRTKKKIDSIKKATN